MAGNIFVSYRRDDSKHAAGRLVDRLHAEFDEDQIFLDVDNIELGLDFIEVINDRVAACDIMLVVIGPSWLAASDDASRRRLEDSNDFVRIEIEAALKRNIRVIPVLVDGADPPRAQDLPESLAPLANRQATRLTHETFSSDAERLTAALARMMATAAPPKPSPVAETAPQTDDTPPEPESSAEVEVKTDHPAEPAEDMSVEHISPEENISNSELSGRSRKTPSKDEFIGIPEQPGPKPAGGDAPRMTREEARDVLSRVDDQESGIDFLGWSIALSPAVFAIVLVGSIVLYNLQPSHFSWFGFQGETVAYSLPLIGTAAAWAMLGALSRVSVSIKARIVGSLLVLVNVGVIVFGPS